VHVASANWTEAFLFGHERIVANSEVSFCYFRVRGGAGEIRKVGIFGTSLAAGSTSDLAIYHSSRIVASQLAKITCPKCRFLVQVDYFRVGGDSTRLLNLPAGKPVVGGNRQYLEEGRMRGPVCVSLFGLATTLAEGAPVMLAASLLGQVESL
jgi:hypothetical protein